MLQISAKPGTVVVFRVGDTKFEMIVRDVHAKKVWIDFDAPPSVEINRQKLDKLKHPEEYAPCGITPSPSEPVNSEVQPVLTREYLESVIAAAEAQAHNANCCGALMIVDQARGRSMFAKELLDKFFPGAEPCSQS